MIQTKFGDEKAEKRRMPPHFLILLGKHIYNKFKMTAWLHVQIKGNTENKKCIPVLDSTIFVGLFQLNYSEVLTCFVCNSFHRKNSKERWRHTCPNSTYFRSKRAGRLRKIRKANGSRHRTGLQVFLHSDPLSGVNITCVQLWGTINDNRAVLSCFKYIMQP